MDFHRSKADGSKPVSVLDGEGEGSHLHRFLSRDPSLGNSSRYYQYRKPGQIPFQWEKQPGKCKLEPTREGDPIDVPRIKPPPISASKTMELVSRPNHIGSSPRGFSLSWSKLKLWRMIKNKKPQLRMPRFQDQARGCEATSKSSSTGPSCAPSDNSRMSYSSNWSSSTSSSSSSSSMSCLSFSAPLQSLNSRT